MKREILFRGQDPKGNWHEGSLITLDIGTVIMTEPSTAVDRKMLGAAMTFSYDEVKAVIPNTVGQFTGRTDKNEIKIFEGDICEITKTRASSCNYFQSDDAWVVEKFIVQCAFEDGCFKFIREYLKKGKYLKRAIIPMSGDGKLEVIGNIHDNPELLNKNPHQNQTLEAPGPDEGVAYQPES